MAKLPVQLRSAAMRQSPSTPAQKAAGGSRAATASAIRLFFPRFRATFGPVRKRMRTTMEIRDTGGAERDPGAYHCTRDHPATDQELNAPKDRGMASPCSQTRPIW